MGDWVGDWVAGWVEVREVGWVEEKGEVGWEGVGEVGWEGVREVGWEAVREVGWEGAGSEEGDWEGVRAVGLEVVRVVGWEAGAGVGVTAVAGRYPWHSQLCCPCEWSPYQGSSRTGDTACFGRWCWRLARCSTRVCQLQGSTSSSVAMSGHPHLSSWMRAWN